MTPLMEYRESIDNLDAALIALLAERFRITKKVGLFKAANHLPEKDAAREGMQMSRIENLSRGAGLNPDIAQAVLRVIIDRVIEEHKEIKKGFFKNT